MDCTCTRHRRYLPTSVKSDDVEGSCGENKERQREEVFTCLLNYGMTSSYDRFPYVGITRTGSKGHSASSQKDLEERAWNFSADELPQHSINWYRKPSWRVNTNLCGI
jgi:hypothetical protein